MTRSYVYHNSFICVPWLVHMYAWVIHMCAMTHSYVPHDSFICVPWLIHMCAMCLPNTASRSNHITTCVHTSPYCAWKVKEITHTHTYTHTLIVVCGRHRTLCTASIPLLLLLSANVCVYHIAYVHSPTPMFGEPPPPQAHAKGVLVCMPTTIQTKTKNSKKCS